MGVRLDRMLSLLERIARAMRDEGVQVWETDISGPFGVKGDVIFGAQDIYDAELYTTRWTRDQPPEPSEWLAACSTRCIFF